MLFQLGATTFECPAGLNATGTTEEFGGDFAVKAVVGAQQPRKFVGPSDHGFSLTGDLFPYAAARAGQDTGLDDIETLRGVAASGEPQMHSDAVHDALNIKAAIMGGHARLLRLQRAGDRVTAEGNVEAAAAIATKQSEVRAALDDLARRLD